LQGGGLAFDVRKMAFLAGFCWLMCPIPDKTDKNRKKPVETEEIRLTKSSEKLKVNCGTVLRTRMNTDDFVFEKGCDFVIFERVRRAGRRIHF